MLDNVHVLLVSQDPIYMAQTKRELESHGAVVHTASKRAEALGIYWNLVCANIHPRAIITGWYMNLPNTKEHEFYKLINRDEDNTAAPMLRRVRQMDPRVLIVINSAYIDDIPQDLRKDPSIKVLQKGTSPKTIYDHIAQTPMIKSHPDRFFSPRPGSF